MAINTINVSNDASKLIPNSDVCILCLPAYAHRYYLDAIRNYHEICNEQQNQKQQQNEKRIY